MCTGKLSKYIAVALWPLAILSILANLLLFFPNWQTMWASGGHLSSEVWYFHGILGAGLLILLPANAAMQAGRLGGCMGGRFKMLGSVIFGVVGCVGSGYCVIVSAVALDFGPYCWSGTWSYFFKDMKQAIGSNYLSHPDTWGFCLLPHNIVEWHVALFSLLLVLSLVELVLCTVQVVNGLMGTLCGSCRPSASQVA